MQISRKIKGFERFLRLNKLHNKKGPETRGRF